MIKTVWRESPISVRSVRKCLREIFRIGDFFEFLQLQRNFGMCISCSFTDFNSIHFQGARIYSDGSRRAEKFMIFWSVFVPMKFQKRRTKINYKILNFKSSIKIHISLGGHHLHHHLTIFRCIFHHLLTAKFIQFHTARFVVDSRHCTAT